MIGNFAAASSGDGISLVQQILIIWILTCSYQSLVIIMKIFWDIYQSHIFCGPLYNDVGVLIFKKGIVIYTIPINRIYNSELRLSDPHIKISTEI